MGTSTRADPPASDAVSVLTLSASCTLFKSTGGVATVLIFEVLADNAAPATL